MLTLARLMTFMFAQDAGVGAAVLERPAAAAAAATPATPGRKRFTVDVPFVKSIEADSGDLLLRGYANTWVQDRDLEIVAPTAFDESLPPYLAKNPILLWQHNMDWPIGQVTKGETDDTGLAVEAVVRQPQEGEEPWKFTAYHAIKAGTVRTFSIGGWFTRDVRHGQLIITEVELWEISVVSIPSNPDSIFEAGVKSLSTGPLGAARQPLPPRAVAQMMQLQGAEPVADPELVAMDSAAADARYDELVVVYRRCGVLPPARGDWERLSVEWDALPADASAADLQGYWQGVSDFIKRVHGMAPDAKKGRVLSTANEKRLTDAYDALERATESVKGVLDQVQQAPEVEDDGTPTDDGDGAPPSDAPGASTVAATAGQRTDPAGGARAAAAAEPGADGGAPGTSDPAAD